MPLVESVKSSLFKYVEKAEEVAEKIDHAKPNLLDQWAYLTADWLFETNFILSCG